MPKWRPKQPKKRKSDGAGLKFGEAAERRLIYSRAGHCGGWLPSGIAGRAQNAGVFDSIAECLTDSQRAEAGAELPR